MKIQPRGVALILFGLLLACLALALCLTWGRAGTPAPYASTKELFLSRYEDIRVRGFVEFPALDFEELMAQAHTVAIVTPTDDLSAENSRYIDSVRTVRAVAWFKNEKNFGDTFEIAEYCVCLDDGTLVISDESCFPMERGDYYLVFLHTAHGVPMALGADNGKFDLTHLRLNDAHTGTMLQALLGLDLLQGRPRALRAAEDYLASVDCSEAEPLPLGGWKTARLTTKWTQPGYELELKYNEKNGLFAMNGLVSQAGPDPTAR